MARVRSHAAVTMANAAGHASSLLLTCTPGAQPAGRRLVMVGSAVPAEYAESDAVMRNFAVRWCGGPGPPGSGSRRGSACRRRMCRRCTRRRGGTGRRRWCSMRPDPGAAGDARSRRGVAGGRGQRPGDRAAAGDGGHHRGRGGARVREPARERAAAGDERAAAGEAADQRGRGRPRCRDRAGRPCRRTLSSSSLSSCSSS